MNAFWNIKDGQTAPPCFVAEMNSSHGGNIETAKRMIDAAREAGCDAVKFQSWSAESLYSAEYYVQNPIAKRMVSEAELAQRIKMRRSIVAKETLQPGHIVTMADLDAKRPGDGIPPDHYDKLLGKRIKRAVEKDAQLTEEILDD